MSTLIGSLCLHSVSNAITASSYEVFTYQDDCVPVIKKLINSFLHICGRNENCDDLFYVCLLPGNSPDELREILEQNYGEHYLNYESWIVGFLESARKEYASIKEVYGDYAFNEYIGRYASGRLAHPEMIDTLFNYWDEDRVCVLSKNIAAFKGEDRLVADAFNELMHSSIKSRAEFV